MLLNDTQGVWLVSIGSYMIETTFTFIVIYIDIHLADKEDTCEKEVHLTLTCDVHRAIYRAIVSKIFIFNNTKDV